MKAPIDQLTSSAKDLPDGTLISFWKPEWNCYHFGFTDGGGIVHYVQKNPKEFVEIQVGESNEWQRCPIEDYEFVKKTLAGLSEVRMRPCQS